MNAGPSAPDWRRFLCNAYMMIHGSVPLHFLYALTLLLHLTYALTVITYVIALLRVSQRDPFYTGKLLFSNPLHLLPLSQLRSGTCSIAFRMR